MSLLFLYFSVWLFLGEYRYKLKSEQIEAGKSSLEIIKNCKEEAKRIDACNEFYTKIPHDFRYFQFKIFYISEYPLLIYTMYILGNFASIQT